MSKIGIIGGSFDPIHKAHVEVFKMAINYLELDKLLVIPTKTNPWKANSDATSLQRLEMINLVLESIDKAEVSTIEIDIKDDKPNYTYITIEKLKAIYPNDELYFIVGMDQANKFNEWVACDEIAKEVQLVAFQRKGYPSNDNIKKYNFLELDNPSFADSSTDVKKGNIEYLPPEILKYITNHGLYLEFLIKPLMSKKRYEHTLSMSALAVSIAKSNGLNHEKAYIAGMFHDIAKEMPHDKALSLMQECYPEYVNKPEPIWHQWLSAYVAKNTYLVEDEEILDAITTHTTGSKNMSLLGKCIYCADKYDPYRDFDSSKEIELCKKDINKGFKQSLKDFYAFSKKKNREIDEVFYEIYRKYVEGEINE